MAANLITQDNLGAWLIKCDPARYDLSSAIEAGFEVVTNWSVANNYRSRMMEPGHKVILWVSGDSKVMDRGIWGIGWVTGYVQDTVHDVDPDEETFWHREEDRLAVTNDITVDIPLFDEAVTAVELVALGITDLEVQIQAQSSNPSWVSKEQLVRLEPLVGEWTDEVEYEEEVTVSQHGAGYGDPLQNMVVEEAAMEAVIDFYDGWRVDDVSLDKVGWDLTFTHKKTGEVAKVEVKGLSGDRPMVLLTANEIRAAEEEADWVLAVVTRALSKPEVVEYTAQEILAAALPYVYRAKLGDS